MKKKVVVVSLALCVTAMVAQTKGRSAGSSDPYYVAPHVTKQGTFVEGHMKTAPNGTKLDNYSTKGNVNPYTGKEGTKDPFALPAPSRAKY